MTISLVAQIDQALKAAELRIHGVSIGRKDDPATWLIRWCQTPTDSQLKTSRAILASFDPSAPQRAQPKRKFAKGGRMNTIRRA